MGPQCCRKGRPGGTRGHCCTSDEGLLDVLLYLLGGYNELLSTLQICWPELPKDGQAVRFVKSSGLGHILISLVIADFGDLCFFLAIACHTLS